MSSKQIRDADVPQILKKDGVSRSVFNEANKEITHVPDLIAKYGRDSSWSHTLVDSPSNSATLIAQMPGQGNRRHFHHNWDEWWFIIEGEWQWEVDGVKKNVKAGDVVFIQRNRPHKITAVGDKIAMRIAVSRYDVDHVYDPTDF